ncbi:uncharacterized protein C8Q71DRAFT_706547 [Rhodofomes roseus]|uniref:Uncharacterized protein n=1 Tax=Rhodofomes roseus TaxID=34475 RepID=A0ABQ8KI60_9APHY|nr:uncharacterized protein C8Q71DRAFT_706547 [Rhodofomes roseus]KAH9837658.1 hypothetical protein C8Q71DRAFT_706547 [Rhodofomes roseus]
MEEALRHPSVVESFPSNRAGAPVPNRDAQPAGYHQYARTFSGRNPWAPFQNRIDWALARWAKLRGPGSNAFTELLKIEGVPEALGLSYRNTIELNKLIDEHIPGRPRFQRREIIVSGEAFEVYFRDVIECIRALFGDAEFAQYLVFVPERHWVDARKTIRLYHDMHTGKWWWATQVDLERSHPGATIIPVILSSDKTQVTLFRNKVAYPLYMTIGNIPKHIRRKPSQRAWVLLAYLPASRMSHIMNKAARRRVVANVYHACVRRILHPLKDAGIEGVEMSSADGAVRHTHPLVAAFSADYQEQTLTTGAKTGECATCEVPPNELGDGSDTQYPIRNIRRILDALALADGPPDEFRRACREAGIKPIYKPWWQDLPYCDIFLAITPDILHQLLQGLIMHIIAWVILAYGAAEIDARCRRMPQNHGARFFLNGITTLSHLSGQEREDICCILLGLIIDLPLPGGLSPVRLVRTVRAILDFLYLAGYPAHTSKTLDLMDDALSRFHANKDIFIDLGIRSNFNLPKLHWVSKHWRRAIEYLGTSDNFDTQYTERLHIDFAKQAYRATNHKDEFRQMTRWLERKEKIMQHERFVAWRLAGATTPSLPNPVLQPPQPTIHLSMTKHPSVASVSIRELVNDYGATYFLAAMGRYVAQIRYPHIQTRRQLEEEARNIWLPFHSVGVHHKAHFWLGDAEHFQPMSDSWDVAHAKPSWKNKHGLEIPARFDTVLVNTDEGGYSGVKGYCVAQVRVMFHTPKTAHTTIFPLEHQSPKHLAYVEWFTDFANAPNPVHGMYKVKREVQNGERLASIIPVKNIRRTVLLFPSFGPVAPHDWTTSNVLEESPTFHVDRHLDRHSFVVVQ